jgi:hypothetical protein
MQLTGIQTAKNSVLFMAVRFVDIMCQVIINSHAMEVVQSIRMQKQCCSLLGTWIGHGPSNITAGVDYVCI